MENTLEFTTSGSEEPLLGFALSLTIEFVDAFCAPEVPSYNHDGRVPLDQVC